MSKYDERLELAKWVVEQAMAAGATDARASLDRRRYVSLSYRERQVEKLEESVENGWSLSLYVDGKYSGHRTSDLRRVALEPFIAEATGMTRHLERDPFRALPEPSLYEGREETDLDLVDPGYAAVAADDRHEMVRAVEAAALDAGGDRIVSVEAGYYDSLREQVMVASNGFVGASEATSFWTGASVTVKDEGDSRPSDWCWEGGIHRGAVTDPQAIGREAVRRALARVGAAKIETERLPLLVENRTAGQLVRFMSNGLYGRNLQQRSSYLEGKKGERIASPLLSLHDDPLIKRGFGSQLYDAEGIAARRIPIIHEGVLTNYYIDTYYARKLETAPTTGRPSNVLLQAGDKGTEAWMKELGRGLLVTGFIGGNSNSSTGDFSTGVYGFLFDGGEIIAPVNELNIAGSHLEFWHKLVGVGNDPYAFSPMRTPSLIFDSVTVAGV